MLVHYLSNPERARLTSWPDEIDVASCGPPPTSPKRSTLRAEGQDVDDENAAHLTPAQHDIINFYGTYSFDLDAELRREGPLCVTG